MSTTVTPIVPPTMSPPEGVLATDIAIEPPTNGGDKKTGDNTVSLIPRTPTSETPSNNGAQLLRQAATPQLLQALSPLGKTVDYVPNPKTLGNSFIGLTVSTAKDGDNQNDNRYKYKVIDDIGAGGMGIVYKAQNLATDKIYALKILPIPDSGSSYRFDKEVKALTELTHPNIVQIIGTGVEGHIPFYISEFADGGDLSKLSQNTNVTTSDFLGYMIQLCSALSHAHNHRPTPVIHRDVKPANILLFKNTDGNTYTPKLGDFGLVHRHSGTKITATGAILGTPDYMAPELVKSPLYYEPSAATDLYSLGVMLFQQCTGELPIQVTEESGFDQAWKVQPKQLPNNINPLLATLIMSLLEKHPAKRLELCKSAQSVGNQLRVIKLLIEEQPPLKSLKQGQPTVAA